MKHYVIISEISDFDHISNFCPLLRAKKRKQKIEEHSCTVRFRSRILMNGFDSLHTIFKRFLNIKHSVLRLRSCSLSYCCSVLVLFLFSLYEHRQKRPQQVHLAIGSIQFILWIYILSSAMMILFLFQFFFLSSLLRSLLKIRRLFSDIIKH